jgi:putative transposase
MSHTYSNILCHIVFSPKGHKNMLFKEMREDLYSYISGISKKEGCYIIKTGGIEDHIHIFVKLKTSISPSEFVRTIKANSSRWIHQKFSNLKDFAWQPGFSCFSVSESAKEDVINYIINQEKHHNRIPFSTELKMFLEKHNVEYDPQYYMN